MPSYNFPQRHFSRRPRCPSGRRRTSAVGNRSKTGFSSHGFNRGFSGGGRETRQVFQESDHERQ